MKILDMYTKRRTWWFRFFLIVLAFTFLPVADLPGSWDKLPFSSAVRAADLEPGASGDLSMDAECGYDGAVKGGRLAPLWVEIENTGASLFQGTLWVKTMASGPDVYEYAYPVSAAAGEDRRIEVYIPTGSRTDQMFVKLEDQEGTVLLEKRLKLNINTDAAELFLGVLSDRADRLSYLDGAALSKGSLQTRLIRLDEGRMPVQVEGLNMMDVILATDYDISRLSPVQYQVLMDWVRRGGVLLFGTGQNGLKAVGPAANELLAQTPMAPMVMDVDMGVEYGISGPADSTIRLTCMDLSLKEGNVILTSDELPVLTSVSYEDGLLALAAYDFIEIDEFCSLQGSYVDKLLGRLLGEERISRLVQAAFSDDSEQYWPVQSMINGGSVDKLPNIILYTVLILLYLALIGPVLYLYLKKRDLSRYYRRGVLILAGVFACVIYLVGGHTRFRSPFFTYATIQDLTEDVIRERTYINVRSPHNQSYQVELDPSYSVSPITGGYDRAAALPKFTGKEENQVLIRYQPSQTSIAVQNPGSFTPRYFYLEKEFENAQKVGITADLHLFEGELSGSITNHFGHAVEHVAVLFYGQVLVIDQLEAGETRSLDGMTAWNYPLGDAQDLAAVIAGTGQYGKGDLNNRSYILAIERANVLTFYLQTYEYGYFSDARILAFSTEKTESQFLKAESHETYGLTMFTSSIQVDRSRGRLTSRTALRRSPEVLGGNYYAAANSIYGPEPVTLEYYLGNDQEIEKIRFEEIEPVFERAGRNPWYLPFKGSIRFYNYDTHSFDLLPEENREFTSSQLAPYLSPGNTITVRYQYEESAVDYSYNIQLPAIYTIGRTK